MTVNHKFLSLFVTMSLLLVLMAACAAQPQATGTTLPATQPPADTTQPTTLPAPAATATSIPGLSEDVLKNATYASLDAESPEYQGGGTMQLVDGGYTIKDPSGTLPDYQVTYLQSASGDLNGDGVPDAVVVLAANPGGSGTFVYLLPAINQDGKVENTSSTFLGDRVQIQSLTIADGAVHLDMLVAGPDDPLCCPSQPASQTYVLKDGRLLTQAEAAVAPLADQAVTALKNQDMAALAQLVQPDAGLRFSPYANVNQSDLAFTPAQLQGLLSDPTVYAWGAYDGSGEPIALAFSDYFTKFVYSGDFASAAQVSFDHPLGSGNTIDNSQEFYPGAVIVEYYLPGTAANGYMDWQSLRLVFSQQGENWYLAGIIHAQWTV